MLPAQVITSTEELRSIAGQLPGLSSSNLLSEACVVLLALQNAATGDVRLAMDLRRLVAMRAAVLSVQLLASTIDEEGNRMISSTATQVATEIAGRVMLCGGLVATVKRRPDGGDA